MKFFVVKYKNNQAIWAKEIKYIHEAAEEAEAIQPDEMFEEMDETGSVSARWYYAATMAAIAERERRRKAQQTA